MSDPAAGRHNDPRTLIAPRCPGQVKDPQCQKAIKLGDDPRIVQWFVRPRLVRLSLVSLPFRLTLGADNTGILAMDETSVAMTFRCAAFFKGINAGAFLDSNA